MALELGGRALCGSGGVLVCSEHLDSQQCKEKLIDGQTSRAPAGY